MEIWPKEMRPNAAQLGAIDQLEAALKKRDPSAVEIAVTAAYRIGLHPSMSAILTLLCEAPWHTRHEDVVRVLQEIGNDASVPALERTAQVQHAYLHYDNNRGLARKCTWALADIGTPGAKESLTRLMASADRNLAGYAAKRLQAWDAESGRKRGNAAAS
jgi:HEAT repeat protein